MAPKRHGKDVMISDVAPSELPEDLPIGCKYNFSWRNPKINKIVLLESIHQGAKGYCWTIVFNRVIAAHLYIHNKVGELLRFSSKHLFAHIKEKFPDGYLKNYGGLKTFLKESGLILECECKCVVGKTEGNITTACDKVKDKKVYKIREFVVVEGDKVDEKELISLLKTVGPIAVHIRVCSTYKSSVKDEIYLGPKENSKLIENHIVLLTGIGTRDGVHFFEYQNTWGSKWGGGDEGFGKFARKISLGKGKSSLVLSYMYPLLLDQVFDV